MHALMNALNHTSILTGLTIFSQRVFIDQTASLSCHAMGSYWRPPQPGRQQYTCIMYYDMKYLKPLKNNVIILISPGHNIRIGPDRAYPLHFTRPQLLLLPVLLPVLLLPLLCVCETGFE